MMGMTDMQFKSHLRQLIALLEKAKKAGNLEKVIEEIEGLQKLLQEDLES